MRRILSSVVLLCLACGDKSEAASVSPAAPIAETKASAAAAPSSKPAPVPAAAPAPAPAPQPSAVPGVDEASARTLVDSWLKAQNAGDFASYESLYAQRFEGEKRAGERLTRFDRKGWLADRKKMFAKPMTVSLEPIHVKPNQASATVDFVQSFSQGSFADRGPKMMVLVREGGAVKIAAERMLASQLADERPPSGFHFVVHVSGKPYVVLERGAERGWGVGEPSAPYVKDGTFATLLSAGASLPPERAMHRGAKLRVFDLEGKSCEASIGALALLAPVAPHFSDVCAFEGRADCADKPGQPLAPAVVAHKLLDMVLPDDLSLVGALEGCDGSFAVAPGTEVEVWPLAGAHPEEAEAALKAATKSKLYAAAARDYRAYMEGAESPREQWFDAPSVHSLGGKDGVVLVDHRATGSCAEFTGSVTTLMSTDGKRPKALFGGRDVDMPTAVLDLGKDGSFELLSRPSDWAGSLTRLTESATQELETVPLSFLDCGC
jgi:hypothetical protein